MQKRYAPAVNILRNQLKKNSVRSYNFRYLTGAYPEGDPLFDLFIHPIDLACFLFGKAEVVACQKVENDDAVTCFVMLKHGETVGSLELSTAYSWTDAKEHLTINATDGIYELDQMEALSYQPKRGSVFGIPLEKVCGRATCSYQLYSRNNFSPILANNQLVSQGYYAEIKAFLDLVECRTATSLSSLPSMRNTFAVLEAMRWV